MSDVGTLASDGDTVKSVTPEIPGKTSGWLTPSMCTERCSITVCLLAGFYLYCLYITELCVLIECNAYKTHVWDQYLWLFGLNISEIRLSPNLLLSTPMTSKPVYFWILLSSSVLKCVCLTSSQPDISILCLLLCFLVECHNRWLTMSDWQFV